MDIDIIPPQSPPPVAHAHTLSMVVKSFKGRRNVEVHLFRGRWSEADEASLPWSDLIDGPVPGHGEAARRLVMEAFTDAERDRVVDYLKAQYSTRLTAIRSMPLCFPVPAGLCGLSEAQPGKSVGFIDFEKIPSYRLDLPLRGYFDLSLHPPIVGE
ncbi:hypothetical protein [Pseudodesulfovibrio pelocollis]|uniref:hypothetical protein n=1 Tax=Pseudodesulfovibrio pelocollis TaxID=3051432 RepID=UPI00255AA168|nr:hypothetical protein [Pseudodesulfovibrio sp. SB368]